MNQHAFFLWFLSSLALAPLSAVAIAEQFRSCADVSWYLDGKIQSDNRYQRYCALQRATALINSLSTDSSQKCDDRLADRTFFCFAQVTDEYATKSFAEKSEGRKKWSAHAARAYEDYLNWVLELPPARQNTLIAKLTETELQDPNFEEKKRRWLRSRIGGALHAMGNSFVREGKAGDLIKSYERCFNSYQRADIFANEAVEQWYRWLRAQPGFKVEAAPSQIKGIIAQCSECGSHWSAFSDFLDLYVKTVSDSFARLRDYWTTENRRIAEWVSAS